MISPTAYGLYNRCPRAWWYRYVGGIKGPTTAALANGSAVHAAVETYLETGAWPVGDAAPLNQARRAEAVLDAARARYVTGGVYSQIEATIDTDLAPYGGVDHLGGRVDWHGRDAARGPWVIDHKTTASPDYWLTPEQLAIDSQLVAYAGALFPHAETVTVGHLYIPPPPTEPVLVTATTTHEVVEDTLGRYARATVAMAAARAVTDPAAVEARTEACWNYGGCPYGGICADAPDALARRLTKPKEEPVSQPASNPGGLAALKARLGLKPAEGTPAPSAAPTTPAPATAGPVLSTPPAATVEASPTPADGAQATSGPGGRRPISDEDLRARLLANAGLSRDAVTPPDAPKRPRKPRNAAPETTTPSTYSGSTGVVSETALLEIAPGTPSSAVTGAGLLGAAPVERPVVYVGCISSVPCATLEDWAADALEAARRAPDGTDCGSYLLVPFGGGPRYAAATIAADLATGRRTLPRRLSIPADHAVAAFLLPALGRYAEIVRGVGR